MKILKPLMLALSLFSLAGSLHAGVNLKNGNFYISYSDIIVYGSGKNLSITRTYNSKSTGVGWFGFGWGSDFETYLEPSNDGSVIVHENGSGANTRFTPKATVDAEEAAKAIVAEMRKGGGIKPQEEARLVIRLRDNAELRHGFAKKYKVKFQVANGTTLYSNDRGMQTLAKQKSGWKRELGNGNVEFFNEKGKLTNIHFKSGEKVEISYNKADRVESIKDSSAKQIFFSWYPDGLIKEMWSTGDKKARYEFQNKNLVKSWDISNNHYVYQYDSNRNLSSVAYEDGKKMLVKYDPKTQFVTEVTERNGRPTSYKYGANPKNPDFHYWTEVTKTTDGKKFFTNKYEYEIKPRPDGSTYTYRIATVVSGLRTETIYTECCSLPLKITKGKHVTNFEYNEKGLLTKKTSTKGDFVEISYHPKLSKITKVVNNDGWTEFEYDVQGNLQKAVNQKGLSVLLVYNRDSRITKMRVFEGNTKEHKTLSFDYNTLGKPVIISMDNIGKDEKGRSIAGKINVDYDNYGEIKKVESKQGHKMALKVTQAFQSLLTIVKPAGVNLNF